LWTVYDDWQQAGITEDCGLCVTGNKLASQTILSLYEDPAKSRQHSNSIQLKNKQTLIIPQGAIFG